MLTGFIDWAEEDTELPSGNLHLWEESWDDDEQNDDFSKQLKCVSHASRSARWRSRWLTMSREELKKVGSSK